MKNKKPQQLDKKLRGSQKKIEGTKNKKGAFYFFLRAALYKIPVDGLPPICRERKTANGFSYYFFTVNKYVIFATITPFADRENTSFFEFP